MRYKEVIFQMAMLNEVELFIDYHRIYFMIPFTFLS